VEAFIQGDDRCNAPDANMANGGIVYRFAGSRYCVCMSKSSIVAQGIADGETESYAMSALN